MGVEIVLGIAGLLVVMVVVGTLAELIGDGDDDQELRLQFSSEPKDKVPEPISGQNSGRALIPSAVVQALLDIFSRETKNQNQPKKRHRLHRRVVNQTRTMRRVRSHRGQNPITGKPKR